MEQTVVKANKKVIFLHGLEAGPWGAKVEYLQARYDVQAPDMEMSAYDFDKKHSFVNSALSVIWSQGILLPMFDTAKFKAESIMVSFTNCVESVRELVSNAPTGTILLGSSWGGAVSLWLIAEGLFKGNCILFAPALKTVMNHSGYSEQQKHEVYDKIRANSLDRGYQIVIMHGDLDIVVPLKDSIELSKAIGAELIIVPLGDHNINWYLLAENHLEGVINRLSSSTLT